MILTGTQDGENRASVFICEDEKLIAMDISASLIRNSYKPAGIFEDAENLLAALEEEQPDIILMDIHLKGSMNGIEAASIINKRWGIPVIMLTAYGDRETIEKAKFSQPYAYLIKPFDERDLRIAIEISAYRGKMEKNSGRLRQNTENFLKPVLSCSFSLTRMGIFCHQTRHLKPLPVRGKI